MAPELLNSPVEEWGFDGLLVAVENGSRAHLHLIALAVESDAHGKVAAELEEVLHAARNTSRTESLRRILFSAMAQASRRPPGEGMQSPGSRKPLPKPSLDK